MGTGLDGHPARHLRHGCQERQAAVTVGHGLVGDGGDATRQQVRGLFGVGRQMEVGEQRVVGSQASALGGQGLLHLHDQLGRVVQLLGICAERGATGHVVLVGESGALPGVALDVDVVSPGGHLSDAGGREPDSSLLVLGLLRNADAHGHLLGST